MVHRLFYFYHYNPKVFMSAQMLLDELKYSLRAFQIRRLEKTYEDLRIVPQYQKAYRFFFQQLYLPKGLATPSVSPTLTLPVTVEAFLDKRIVAALRKAARLQQVIENCDNRLCDELFSAEIEPNGINLATYQHYYVKSDNYEERVDQFILMAEVIGELYYVSQMQLLRFTLEVGRKLAGRHPLLQLAEDALEAFKDIKDIDFLTETIEIREIAFHNALWENNLPEEYTGL